MTGVRAKNVYNIPAWQPFAKTLAAYLLQQTGGKPELLTKYRLLLPTRRTCRVMRETFLAINNGRALLLPQMSALGDVDEEELSLMMFGKNADFLEVPAPISPLKRQILLARLIYAMPDFAQGMEHALRLARALSRFIDQVIVEDLDFSDLHKVVPEEFSEHWQITLEFLRIISEVWPRILEEEALVDAAEHRNLMLHALAQHWKETPPDGFLIAAGSSGSIPAAAELLRTIAGLERGMVILPGLDQDMDEVSWKHINESHPQHSLKLLLRRIEIERGDVRDLDIAREDAVGARRHKLASAMMLPAQATHQWQDFARSSDLSAMTQGLEYYQCSTQSEEAGLIAMIMREALEEETKICALVTPDRGLARRVKAFCKRWNIEVDDSAGINLADTPQGKLALLCLEAARQQFDPVAFLSVLKSALCRFGYSKEEVRLYTGKLEKNVLRQAAVITSHTALRDIVRVDGGLADEIKGFIEAFYRAMEPLMCVMSGGGVVNVEKTFKAHIETLEALALDEPLGEDGSSVYWSGDAGRQMAQFFAQLLEHAHLMQDISYGDYINIFAALMRDVTLRVAYGMHPRLLILGQLEARLTKADVVILGGLNEGVWPPEFGHDPWMSRPMRKEFGLPAQDQKIGFAAHDFVQGFCSARVVMTRAQKVDGTPTLPSRWLDRLETIFQAGDMSLADLSNKPYLAWLNMLDNVASQACERPKPCPPLAARPRGVSVTKVDTWLRDPYSIYLHYVLGLRKLRPLRQDNDAALKGTLLHSMLDRFTQLHPNILPDDAQEQFLLIAKGIMDKQGHHKDFVQAWWPRLTRMAGWVVDNETEWREKAHFIVSEARGNIDLDVDGQPFNLHGIADRIDRREDDGYALIDYKSGGVFSEKKLKEAALSQLPLEALILQHGGFDGREFGKSAGLEAAGIPRGYASYLGYWKISGAQDAGHIACIEGDISETIKTAKEGLENLVRTYRDESVPYYCLPDISQKPRYYDYELVSRIKEWSVVDDQESGAASTNEEGQDGY
jgi:ATP-dependent helicase/nuclease subunit B